MKRIFCFVILLIVPAFAAAADICTTLNPDLRTKTCSGGYGYFGDYNGWSVSGCASDTRVYGIGMCATDMGFDNVSGKIVEDLEVSSTASKNKYCWCKTLEPAVSFWVGLGDIGPTNTYATCMSGCSSSCGWRMSSCSGGDCDKMHEGLLSNWRDSAGVNPGGVCPTGDGWHSIEEEYLSLADASTNQCPAGTYGGVEDAGGNEADTICAEGEEYSEAGEQCAPRCGDGYTELHTENGLIFKVWAQATTEHSIVLQRAGSSVQCYVNLVVGDAADAINVKIGDDNYHTTN